MSGAPRRLYWTGTVAALLTAGFHTLGHLQGPQPAANDSERELLRLMTTYAMELPGAPQRTMWQLFEGFSWVFSLYLLATGASALLLLRLRGDDGALLRAFAGVQGASLGLCLVISLGYFFLIPSVCVGVAAAGFVGAALWPSAR